jgi:hypothetical protein
METNQLGRLERALGIKNRLTQGQLQSVQQRAQRMEIELTGLRQQQSAMVQELSSQPLPAAEITRRWAGMQHLADRVGQARNQLSNSFQQLRECARSANATRSAHQRSAHQLEKAERGVAEQREEAAREDLLPFVLLSPSVSPMLQGMATTQGESVAMSPEIGAQADTALGSLAHALAGTSISSALTVASESAASGKLQRVEDECSSLGTQETVADAPELSKPGLNDAGVDLQAALSPGSGEQPTEPAACSLIVPLEVLASAQPGNMLSQTSAGTEQQQHSAPPRQAQPQSEAATRSESVRVDGQLQIEVAAASGRVLQLQLEQRGPEAVYVRLQASNREDRRVLWRERHLLRSALHSEGLFAEVE